MGATSSIHASECNSPSEPFQAYPQENSSRIQGNPKAASPRKQWQCNVFGSSASMRRVIPVTSDYFAIVRMYLGVSLLIWLRMEGRSGVYKPVIPWAWCGWRVMRKIGWGINSFVRFFVATGCCMIYIRAVARRVTCYTVLRDDSLRCLGSLP